MSTKIIRAVSRWVFFSPQRTFAGNGKHVVASPKTPSVMKIACCAFNLVLLTWLAGLAADSIYSVISYQFSGPPALVHPAEADHGAANREIAASGTAVHRLSYYNPITRRDLFNTRGATKKLPQPADDTGHLEATQLDAKLWGTVSGASKSRFAVVEAKDDTNRHKQLLLREGDRIENATIEKILRDKLVISLEGRRQVLLLEDYKSRVGRRPIRRVTARGTRTYRRSIRRSIIEKAVSNVRKVMTQAKIIPRNDGLAISAIKPGSIFRRLGLRNGDIISAVNGRGIQSADDALSLYNRLRNDTSVTLDISRHGRPMTFRYSIR